MYLSIYGPIYISRTKVELVDLRFLQAKLAFLRKVIMIYATVLVQVETVESLNLRKLVLYVQCFKVS